jgi:hypothetical protein
VVNLSLNFSTLFSVSTSERESSTLREPAGRMQLCEAQ